MDYRDARAGRSVRGSAGRTDWNTHIRAINMKTTLKVATAVAATLLLVLAGGLSYVVATGLSARPVPGSIETRLARAVRRWAGPRDVGDRTPPLPPSAEAIAEARDHFARYCATCHANDGSGDAPIGQALFPRAPDMRQAPTQELTDGELFYIIEYGVRFTGMPAWGDGSPKGEELGWKLVHFIRHLPKLTPEELMRMERQNPKLPQ